MGERGRVMGMSYVSGVTLCTSCSEEDDDDGNSVTWSEVNSWLVDRHFAPLARVEDSASGTKHPQLCIGIGGYNGFPCDEFAVFVMLIKWHSPRQVVLTMVTENDSVCVWVPREGKDPRPALATSCRRCGAPARQWCWMPESTWPLHVERGTPEPEDEPVI
jgi:hypothetical protein